MVDGGSFRILILILILVLILTKYYRVLHLVDSGSVRILGKS